MEHNLSWHTYSTSNSSQNYDYWLISSETYKPAKAERYCLLHKCKQEHRQQTIQEAHCCSSNHVHHRAFCILQWHPAQKTGITIRTMHCQKSSIMTKRSEHAYGLIIRPEFTPLRNGVELQEKIKVNIKFASSDSLGKWPKFMNYKYL